MPSDAGRGSRSASSISATTPMLASVFDRLNADSGTERGQTLAELRARVLRDLQTLLNTRSRVAGWPVLPRGVHDELAKSIVSYGLPEQSTIDLREASRREEFRRLVQETIKIFEPRLRRADVQINNVDSAERHLTFSVDAELLADPFPERLAFDARIDPADSTITLGPKGGLSS